MRGAGHGFVLSHGRMSPLWLCPLRQSPQPSMHPLLEKATAGEEEQELMLNIGLWRYGAPRPDDSPKTNQDLERELRKWDGIKWLYAQTYHIEDAFWECTIPIGMILCG